MTSSGCCIPLDCNRTNWLSVTVFYTVFCKIANSINLKLQSEGIKLHRVFPCNIHWGSLCPYRVAMRAPAQVKWPQRETPNSFCRKWRDRRFRLDRIDQTLTMPAACAQKMSPGLRGRTTKRNLGPLPGPQEPLQPRDVWGMIQTHIRQVVSQKYVCCHVTCADRRGVQIH